MAKWSLVVNDEVVWSGDSKDDDTKDELANFMDVVHENILPGAIPAYDNYDGNNWKHLVRASILLATDFYGTPTVLSPDFTVDEVAPYYPAPSGEVQF